MRYEGPYGVAMEVPRGLYADHKPAVLGTWLLTAPQAHPAWSQYHLGVISLADIPGEPPAALAFPGATHEFLLLALNPEGGPHTVDTVATGKVRHLTPINVCLQVNATDDEVLRVLELCARAVTDGHLWPETADAADVVRATWALAIQQSLDHLHGLHLVGGRHDSRPDR